MVHSDLFLPASGYLKHHHKWNSCSVVEEDEKTEAQRGVDMEAMKKSSWIEIKHRTLPRKCGKSRKKKCACGSHSPCLHISISERAWKQHCMVAAGKFGRHGQIASNMCNTTVKMTHRNTHTHTGSMALKWKHRIGAKYVDGHGASMKKRIYLHLMSSECKRNGHKKTKQRGVLTLMAALIHKQCTGRLCRIRWGSVSVLIKMLHWWV